MISIPEDLTELKERARRDDWHLSFVGSDIRLMLGEIERLRREVKHSRGYNPSLQRHGKTTLTIG